jgi:hypothetical protein
MRLEEQSRRRRNIRESDLVHNNNKISDHIASFRITLAMEKEEWKHTAPRGQIGPTPLLMMTRLLLVAAAVVRIPLFLALSPFCQRIHIREPISVRVRWDRGQDLTS